MRTLAADATTVQRQALGATTLSAYLDGLKDGVRYPVPACLADTAGYNDISDVVVERLSDAVQLCAESAGPGSELRNLAGLLMHELVRTICAAAFHAKDSRLLHAVRTEPSPFRSSTFRSRVARRVNLRRSSEVRGSDSSAIAVGASVPIHLPELRSAFLEAGLRNYRLVEGRLRCYIPNVGSQVRILKSSVANILQVLKDKHGFDLHLHADCIERYVVAWVSSRPVRPPGRAVLCGTLCRIEERTAATEYAASGLPAIGVWHGESSGVLNEPVFAYGEAWAVTDIVAYGENPDGSLVGARAFGTPRFHSASSTAVASVFGGKSIRPLRAFSAARAVYVPTSLSGYQRYGPYRDISDVAYLDWQIGLLTALRQRFGSVVWKLHPKDRVLVRVPEIAGVAATRTPLGGVIGEADVFVFDYVSSAFGIAAATDKPIIYIDIGLRNLSDDAREAVERRCIVVRLPAADGSRASDALDRALRSAEDNKVNEFSPRFSISRNGRTPAQAVAEILTSYWGGNVDRQS